MKVRDLLAAIIIAVFMLPVWAQAQAPAEQAAVAQIEAKGGRVYRNAEGQADMVSLTGDQITNADLELLQSLPALRNLSLDGSRVTDQGLDQLLKLPNLEEVSLLRTSITPAAAQALKDRHPQVFHVALSPRARPAALAAIALVALSLGAWGVWLLRAAHNKRAILPPRQYAMGIGYGMLLVVVSVVLVVAAIARSLGFDFS